MSLLNKQEAGFSLIDALLGLFIWSTCALFFLPLYNDMRLDLIEAKQAMHVADVMAYGTRVWSKTGATEGQHHIDDISYTYTISLPNICVSYTARNEAETVCKNFSSDSMALH